MTYIELVAVGSALVAVALILWALITTAAGTL